MKALQKTHKGLSTTPLFLLAKIQKCTEMRKNMDDIKDISGGKIVLYKNKLEVRLEKETVWLSINQIAELFGRDKSVISRHLNNIYKTKELNRSLTVAFFATVQNEGGGLD